LISRPGTDGSSPPPSSGESAANRSHGVRGPARVSTTQGSMQIVSLVSRSGARCIVRCKRREGSADAEAAGQSRVDHRRRYWDRTRHRNPVCARGRQGRDRRHRRRSRRRDRGPGGERCDRDPHRRHRARQHPGGGPHCGRHVRQARRAAQHCRRLDRAGQHRGRGAARRVLARDQARPLRHLSRLPVRHPGASQGRRRLGSST